MVTPDKRRRPWIGLAIMCVGFGLLVGTLDPVVAGPGPRIVEIYPNTIYPGNTGEFIAVEFPEPTSIAGWTLTAGDTTASLPNRTVEGRVVFSTDPATTRTIVDDPVLELTDHFTIAQAGGTVRLSNGSVIIDERRYDRAAVAHRWIPDGQDEWEWIPLGATAFDAEPVATDGVTAFTLPDSPAIVRDVFEEADDRILLAGYTFESESVATSLKSAADRGVRVRVLVDGTPVGGQTDREAELLDSLAESGIEVRVFDGPRQRYNFHHPKYAVIDDRLIVTTENWKPAGIEGRSSRGWGVIVDGPEPAATAAAIFDADASWEDTTHWQEYRRDRSFVEANPAAGTYPSRIEPEHFAPESVTIITAPDNAESELLSLIESAEHRIDIKQVRIGDGDFPLLRAAVNAAERGVQVRILLDHSWYVETQNRALAATLTDSATSGELPIEVRIVDPQGRFEKIHAKGIIVDERHVVVGSINWNNNSVRHNREVAVSIEDEAVAAYFTAVFAADWSDAEWQVPVEFLGIVVGIGVTAGLLGNRTIRFEG